MLIVAGEALIDLLVDPHGGVLAVPGGGPFNAARTAGRLGTRTGFLGRLSTDRFGDRLLDALRAAGVELLATDRTSAPTTLAIAELDADGAATYRFHLAETSAPDLRPEHLPEVLDARALHVGSLALVLEPMADTVERIVIAATEDQLVIVDLNCRPAVVAHPDAYRARVHRVLARADVVKASVDDLAYLEPGVDPLVAATKLLQGPTEVVLLTDGGAPVRVVRREGTSTLPVVEVEIVDTVGAGDAFGAAFASWWLRTGATRADLRDGAKVLDAAAAATVVASATCARRGAEPPQLAELPSPW